MMAAGFRIGGKDVQAAIRRPRRWTTASATSRANAASRGSCCSCPLPPTSPGRPGESQQLRPDQRREERRLATSWVDRLKVRTPSIEALCLNLSGRQPAEGRAGQMAERQGEGPHPGPSDPRSRRRRQGGGLRPRAAADVRGRRGDPDVGHAGRDHRPQPHGAGHARRCRSRIAPPPTPAKSRGRST